MKMVSARGGLNQSTARFRPTPNRDRKAVSGLGSHCRGH